MKITCEKSKIGKLRKITQSMQEKAKQKGYVTEQQCQNYGWQCRQSRQNWPKFGKIGKIRQNVRKYPGYKKVIYKNRDKIHPTR